jgi:hypothetical protein
LRDAHPKGSNLICTVCQTEALSEGGA